MAKKKSKKKKEDDPWQGVESFLKTFRELMDDAQDSIYVLDSNGVFRYMNKKGLKKLGLNEAEIIGIDFREIIGPDDLENTINNFIKRLKGESMALYETSVVSKDGTPIDIEVSGTLIKIDGKVLGEWGIARDITERKVVEKEEKTRSLVLEQEVEARIKQTAVYERNIEIFMKNSNDAIIIIDPDRKITSWNRGAEIIYGYDPSEVMGEPLSIVIPPELRMEFNEVLREVERRGHIRNFETERIKKDGSRITIQSTLNVIRNEEGVVLGFAAIKRDISEQKKMQRELIMSKLELEQAYEKLVQHNIVLEDNVRKLEKSLKIKPVMELGAYEGGEVKYDLNPRRCYLIKDHDPETALQIFANQVLKKGMHGLIVTRILPTRIRKKYKLQKTPVVWLTTNRIPEETCVSPSGIAELSSVIVSFLDQTKNGIVLVEGIEYLISQNNFRSILNLIQLINDKIMISDSRILITLDPKTIDEKEAHLVQKEASDLLETGSDVDYSKRYEHLLDRFKFEPERGGRR